MPRKAKHPCHHPGCPKLTEGRFCEEHQKEENKRYEKYGRDPATRKRCVGHTIHLCHDSLVYQMLSAIHQTAESAGKGTTGTDEVTAFRTVPFLYGRWLDFRGTHGGLGKSVPGISQPW